MLTGDKIILRPIEEKDIEKFFTWRNDLEIKNEALMHPFPVTKNSEKNWFENISSAKDNRLVIFSIVCKETNELIGFIKLIDINWIHRFCYFGIVIGDKSAQGKGYGKEATKLIINYAFNILNLKKILLEVVENNIQAIKIYKKLGFIEEGRLKRQVYLNGNWQDVLIMSLFRNEED